MLELGLRQMALESSFGRVARHRNTVLLATLVVLLLVSPILDDNGVGGLLLSGLFSLLLVVSTFVVSRSRRDLIIVLLLSLPWLYLTWLHPVWSGTLLDEVAGALLAALTLYMAAVLLFGVVMSERVDHDIISGAIGVYLLMGIAWSVVFVLIEGLVPGSFSLGGTEQGTIWSQLLYFSFATITTLGYGDVAPLSPMARIWAILEAVCGTLYLAVLISRLVGLYAPDVARSGQVRRP